MTAVPSLVNAGGQGGGWATGPDFATSANGVNLDPKMLDILKTAAQTFPLKVEAFSGVQDRASGTTNHPGGFAIDVRIYGRDGTPLANSPADAERRGQNLADNYRTYEAFAQTARDIQTRTYPDLNQNFRWGGYFIAGDTPFDLMHFDDNPAMGGQTGGGTWENGLGSDGQRLLPGTQSVGMNDVVKGQLADLGFKGPTAVQDYQKANGLTVDGIIGPQTTAAVARAVTPPAKLPNPYGMRDVMTAAASGDPASMSAALATTAKATSAALASGEAPGKVQGDLVTFMTLMKPHEQAGVHMAYAAEPALKAAMPPVAANALIPSDQVPRLGATPTFASLASRGAVAAPPAADGMVPRLRPPAGLTTGTAPPPLGADGTPSDQQKASATDALRALLTQGDGGATIAPTFRSLANRNRSAIDNPNITVGPPPSLSLATAMNGGAPLFPPSPTDTAAPSSAGTSFASLAARHAAPAPAPATVAPPPAAAAPADMAPPTPRLRPAAPGPGGPLGLGVLPAIQAMNGNRGGPLGLGVVPAIQSAIANVAAAIPRIGQQPIDTPQMASSRAQQDAQLVQDALDSGSDLPDLDALHANDRYSFDP